MTRFIQQGRTFAGSKRREIDASLGCQLVFPRSRVGLVCWAAALSGGGEVGQVAAGRFRGARSGDGRLEGTELLLQREVELVEAVDAAGGDAREGLVGEDKVGLPELVRAGDLAGWHDEQTTVAVA